MRTSLIALGLLSLGLAQCSGDRGLLVGGDRTGGAGQAGDPNESGGTGSSMSGGTGGTESSGGSGDSGGTVNRGGTGSGAEGGEPSTGGTGGSDRGGTGSGADAGQPSTGGTDSGGTAGSGTDRGGSGGSDQAGMGGTAARGGVDSGGRAGASNAGAGGNSDVDCDALAREYQQLLVAVQQCAPLLTVEQCTRQMPDSIVCGCPTYVNPMRESDIRRMTEIIEKARASCTWICPAIACPVVRRGVCSADAIVGTDRGRCTAMP